MRRYKHNLSSYKLLTCKMGELVPVNLVEVLPGDTFRGNSAVLLRCMPLVAPVMHPVQVRLHHWFVPARLVWSGFEDFITGGPDGEGGSAGVYPTISSGGSGFTAGTLPDYLGIPPGVANLSVAAMPFRAYNLIFNLFYRDQDLVSEVSQDSTALQRIAWEKDYFGTARPWPQKGPDITLPLGTEAPVRWDIKTGTTTGDGHYVWDGQSAGGARVSASYSITGAAGSGGNLANGAAGTLYADLSTASAVNVNDVRLAFALQRYQEARARYGSEYVDYLRYLGIRPSDARLQRPEYLGGGKQTIAFSEVLQTGVDAEDAGVGNLRGHGIAAVRSRGFQSFFEEHGFVISLLSVRPKVMYTNALDRMWSRRTKEDYFQKELEAVGQQVVYRREIFAEADNNGNGGDKEFGYQNRYDEYRHQRSQVAGDFRSSIANSWHLSRDFGVTPPALNSTFVTCDPSPRIFAEQTEDNLYCMVQNTVVARRMVNASGESRIY